MYKKQKKSAKTDSESASGEVLVAPKTTDGVIEDVHIFDSSWWDELIMLLVIGIVVTVCSVLLLFMFWRKRKSKRGRKGLDETKGNETSLQRITSETQDIQHIEPGQDERDGNGKEVEMKMVTNGGHCDDEDEDADDLYDEIVNTPNSTNTAMSSVEDDENDGDDMYREVGSIGSPTSTCTSNIGRLSNVDLDMFTQ